MGKQLTLLFDPLESIVLFLSGAYKVLTRWHNDQTNTFISHHRELRCTGRQVKLVGGHDSHV